MPKLVVLKRTLRPWDNGKLLTSSLEFATYGGKQVLVQGKLVEGPQWDGYIMQMKCLTVFLMSLSDKSFRSLPCLGYYPLQRQGRHGIVYSMPDDGNDETNWDVKSLKDLLVDQALVSLKRRVELARTLAKTVLQLHTAGWLQKNLRSDTIVFLAPRGSSAEFFLNSEPYIIGYEYARSDTDDAALAFTHLPDTELEADLYRHPQARGVGRETYQKRFDMYAMACIIVELVMWKPLVDVFSTYLSESLKDLIAIAQASNEIVELPELKDLFEKEEAERAFKHQAGDAVLEVVKMCFLAERAKEGEEALLTDQTTAVDKLVWCRL
jgi:hypothetical protein